MELPTTIRLLTLAILLLRFAYWVVTEPKAHAAKPKSERKTVRNILIRGAGLVLGLVITLQLLGWQVLPFPPTLFLQWLGFLGAVLGSLVSILARIELGSNWAHAAEYQIKQGHTLVQSGIYGSIRHPIYSGMYLSVIGAELAAGSYLAVILGVILPVLAVHQADREERLLEKHFGAAYASYRKRTWRFIPYLW